MTRRDFFRLFVLGGIFGIVGKKLRLKNKPKRAMFWRKKT